ncbi:MAG: hypothetical protein EXS31_11545 [Pedosphaera sp.]|nr:hypothetical protein [Pedosphaera sp.]
MPAGAARTSVHPSGLARSSSPRDAPPAAPPSCSRIPPAWFGKRGHLAPGGGEDGDHAVIVARFNYPSGIAVNSAGDIYAADGRSTIRKGILTSPLLGPKLMPTSPARAAFCNRQRRATPLVS